MPTVELNGRTYVVDEDGFLDDPTIWNEQVAADLATTEDIATLSEDQWKLVNYIHNYYLEFRTAPMIRKLCKDNGFKLNQVYEMFPIRPREGRLQGRGAAQADGLRVGPCPWPSPSRSTSPPHRSSAAWRGGSGSGRRLRNRFGSRRPARSSGRWRGSRRAGSRARRRRLGVIGRMLLEVCLFRSLFRNAGFGKTSAGPGGFQGLIFPERKALWLGAMALHWSLFVIVVRHLRLFVDPVPRVVVSLAALDGFFEVGSPRGSPPTSSSSLRSATSSSDGCATRCSGTCLCRPTTWLWPR